MSRVRGLRVVITGASGGIGSAAVAKLESAGAEVRGIDVRAAPGVEVADVTERVQIQGAVDRAAGELNGIDVLVNNAGIGQPQDAGGFPDEMARAIMDVNFFGAWNSTAAAMPHLLASRGHVVNVSSGLALVNLPFATAYSASKRALDAYSGALRLEYEGRLSVTSVHPGYIRTPIHHPSTLAGASLEGLARPDSLEDAAEAIVRAVVNRPRTISTGHRSSIELWAARRFGRATGWVIARRLRRWRAARAAPAFIRFPDAGDDWLPTQVVDGDVAPRQPR